MNKTEKKAFEMLSKEKQSEVAGGEQIREDKSLTDKQCSKLREAVSDLSEEEQLQIAGGENISEETESAQKKREKLEQLPTKKPIEDDPWMHKIAPPPTLDYGLPSPRLRPLIKDPDLPNWQK